MARLADQIEEIEENLACAEGRVNELEEENDKLKDEVCGLEDQVYNLEAQLEWIHELHPELEAAYDAKLRLDAAA